MQLFLFITGKAFSGKDTFFNAITQIFPNVSRYPFALEVKKEFIRLNPQFTLEQLLNDPVVKSKVRKELINIGDGYREQHGNKIWINKHYNALREDNVFTKTQQIVCVTDTRYFNEMDEYPQFIMQYNPDAICLRVRIVAELQIRLSRMPHDGAINYIRHGLFSRSECELDDYKTDVQFTNNVNSNNPTWLMREKINTFCKEIIQDILKFRTIPGVEL